MDDFYNEMKYILESTSKSEDLESSKSYSYFPNIYAEALIPINPRRWPAFNAGSAMASDMPDIGDKIKTPFDNLLVAKEYLETSQSDIQWRARFWQVTEDTTSINMACELGGEVGSFGAGATSNKIAEGYMNEMIDSAVSMNRQEELNFEIFKQTAREQNMDIYKVRGTGVAREFVPKYMQGDLCEHPERNARPQSWENNDSWTDDGICFDYSKNPNTPINPSDGVELDLPNSNPDSSNYSDGPISNTENSDENGGIFGKIFDFLGFGGADASSSDIVSLSCSTLSPDDVERQREQVEKRMMGWWGDDDDGMCAGGIDPLLGLDPSHPSLNPPMFLNESIPPPDS